MPQPADDLMSYSTNYLHWFLQLMELDDTAKEGDHQRLIVNAKFNLFFFYSHSTLSKYFVENLDFLLKVEHLLSPAMRRRVLEGSFVNVRGGVGNNVEADLAQEHSVRNRKDMIRQLGSNKTNKAMLRLTNAADAVATLVTNLDRALGIRPAGGRHTKRDSQADALKIQDILTQCKPFSYTQGRQCTGFAGVKASPLFKINPDAMDQHMTTTVTRLFIGMPPALVAEEDEDEPDEEEEDEEEVDSEDNVLPEL